MKYFLITLFLLFFSIDCESQPFFAFTQFRHGARAPIFSSDSEVDDYGMTWKSPGELTKGGHRMHYLLGVYNRKRYVPNLLSEKYDPHELYVIGSDYNRTIQSALSQLQGLYPADTSNTLNEKQKKYSLPELSSEDISKIQEEIDKLGDAQLPNYINLIPVHGFQDEQFRYRNFDNPKCKNKSEELMKGNENNEIIVDRLKKFEKDWKPYFDKFFQEKTYDYKTLEKLADLFITDISEGFEFVDFKSKTGLDDTKMKELYDFFVEFVGRTMNNYQYGDKNSELIKLDMSPIFLEMVEFIKRRINREADIKENKKINYKDYSCPKLVMVSGHDSLISAMLLFLGVMYNDREKFWKVPVYAANIAFEVINNKDTFSREDYSQYTIKCLFNGQQIKDAEFQLDDFFNKVNAIAWNYTKITEFCGIKKGDEGGKGGDTTPVDNSGNKTLVIVLGVVCGFLFILNIVFVVLWRKTKTSSSDVETSPLMGSD